VSLSEPRYNAACDAGWSSQVARRAHNPEVAGSNPAPATAEGPGNGAFRFCRSLNALETFARSFALIGSGGRVDVLKIRTRRGMVSLNDQEAAELRERLRAVPTAQSAEETIAVSVNASTSVTFTETEKTAVVDVITKWLAELGPAGTGSGPLELREALTE
jgi:hypothetical protein